MTTSEKPGLTPPKSAKELLDMYFLEIRCNLLEAAAGLDRVERSENGAEVLAEDPRAQKLMKALKLLEKTGASRAEEFLNLFSE